MSTALKHPTCEERIDGHLRYHLADMRKFLKTYERACQLNADDAIDELETRRLEEPIGYSKYTVHKVEYSWGGPADWFEVWEDNGEIARIIYHFSDWFDHAERELHGAEFETARDYVQPLLGFE